jgi:hypothetical protein
LNKGYSFTYLKTYRTAVKMEETFQEDKLRSKLPVKIIGLRRIHKEI